MGAREILLVSTGRYLGGAECSLLALAGALDPARYRAHAALPSDAPREMSEELNRLGVPTHAIDFPLLRRTRNPLRLANYYFALKRAGRAVSRLCWRHGLALMHANTTSAMLCCAFPERHFTPPVVWFHRDRDLPKLAGKFCARAAAAASVSAEGLEQVRAFLPAEKTVLIEGGVALGRFAALPDRRESRRQLGFGADEPLLLCASHFAPWKRHDLFLQTLAEVRKVLPETRGVIAAADASADRDYGGAEVLALAEKLGVAEALVCRGFSAREMPALYSACDALVHLAEREPFGRAVAESIACGLPVVAADSGGPRHLVGAHGVLVKPGDVASAAAEAVKFLKRRYLPRETEHLHGLRDMGRFSAETVASKIMGLYDLALAGNA